MIYPHTFLLQFILLFFVQCLTVIAWTAIISFILYLSKSMIAALGGYLFCASLTGALAQFYPKSLWLQHLTMSFDFDTLQSSGVTLRIVLIALFFRNRLHRSKSLYFPQKGFIVNNELALDWLILIFSILKFL